MRLLLGDLQVWQQWEVAGVLRQGGGVQVFMQDARGLAALRFIEGADSVVPVADPTATPHGAVLSPCAVCCPVQSSLSSLRGQYSILACLERALPDGRATRDHAPRS